MAQVVVALAQVQVEIGVHLARHRAHAQRDLGVGGHAHVHVAAHAGDGAGPLAHRRKPHLNVAAHGVGHHRTAHIAELDVAVFHVQLQVAGHVAHHQVAAVPVGLVVLHAGALGHLDDVVGVFARSPHNAHRVVRLRHRKADFSVVNRRVVDGAQALGALGRLLVAVALNHQFVAINAFHGDVAALHVEHDFTVLAADFGLEFLSVGGLDCKGARQDE